MRVQMDCHQCEVSLQQAAWSVNYMAPVIQGWFHISDTCDSQTFGGILETLRY